MYLKRHQLTQNHDFWLLVNIYLDAIELHHQLSLFSEAVALGTHICRFLVSVDSMYQMGWINLALAKASVATKSHHNAKHYLDLAMHFGDYYQNAHLIDQAAALRGSLS